MNQKRDENISAISSVFTSDHQPVVELMQNEEIVEGWNDLIRKFIDWASVFTKENEALAEANHNREVRLDQQYDPIMNFVWYDAIDLYVASISSHVLTEKSLPCLSELERFASQAMQTAIESDRKSYEQALSRGVAE